MADTSYIKVVVTSQRHKNQTDYMKFDIPLIMDLRYFAYFLKETLVIYLNKNGTFSHMCIDQLKWDGVKNFTIKMHEKERDFAIPPLGRVTYNAKVINDNHQIVLDKDGKETKVVTGLSASVKKD